MLSCDCSSLLYISNSSVKHLSELCRVLGNILSLGSIPRISGFSSSGVGLRICISNKFPGSSDDAENNQGLACCGANQLAGGGKEIQTDGCECSLTGERKRTYQNIQQKTETRKEVSN